MCTYSVGGILPGINSPVFSRLLEYFLEVLGVNSTSLEITSGWGISRPDVFPRS